MSTTKNPTNSKGSSSRYRFAALALIALLTLGLAAWWIYYKGFGQFASTPRNSAEVATVTKQAGLGPTVEIREFIVNIISEDNTHYLRTSMTIEMSSENAREEMNQRMPQIRDAILMLISNKTFEEVYDLHGKKQLKAELLHKINEILTRGEAVSVYLTDFVVQ